MKVFITRKIPKEAVELLRQKKYSVKIFSQDKPVTKEQLLKEAAEADGIISLLTDKFNADVLDQLKKCRVIANYAVGYNNIDISHAKRNNIIVTNTPDILTDATADLAISLLLSCSRRIVESEKFMRKKKFIGWKPELLLGFDLKEKYFGVIGAGRIGTAAAIRAGSFGCRILYYSNSRNEQLEEKTGAVRMGLDSLLKKSDFISIHLPLTDKTYHLLNSENLCLLKPEAILINTARGEIVDEKFLIKILKQKKIFAAGLDVYEGEPAINPYLYKLNNLVMLPHIGSATIETRREMALLCAKNVIAVLSGKKPLTPVF
jgi:glyoxylate reductase